MAQAGASQIANVELGKPLTPRQEDALLALRTLPADVTAADVKDKIVELGLAPKGATFAAFGTLTALERRGLVVSYARLPVEWDITPDGEKVADAINMRRREEAAS